MTEPDWLGEEAILYLHRISLERFGGAPGLRDRGLMEAAIARPQQIFSYSPEADLAVLATAYAAGFVRNHAFVDGNKRIGFAACNAFLGANGFDIDANDHTTTEMMVGLASRTVSEEQFAEWLRGCLVPVPDDV